MNLKYFVCVFILMTVFIAGRGQSLSEQLPRIDTFLGEEYPKNEPGAAVLIAKDGMVIYKKAFGLADLEKKMAMDTDMIFPIGSMAKQFTSGAVLQLVERGKLSLDDDIRKYIEYYPEKEYTVTIENLLSQTSGIPELFDVDESEYNILSQEHTPRQLIEYYSDRPLLFRPGTKFQYSNSNYPLLGAVIEKISGLPLKDYFERYIFEPLGMDSSALWYTKDLKSKRIPQGYRFKKGNLVPAPKVSGSTVYAAGGIVSTVGDLLAWNRALRNRSYLSDYIVDRLTTEKTTLDGKGTGYGFGFFTKELQGIGTIQHGGIMYGFTSSGLYLPEPDIFICILSNKTKDRTEQLADYIASLLIGKPIHILGRSELDYAEKEEYLGSYKMIGNNAKIIEIKLSDGLMTLEFPEAPDTRVEIVSVKRDTFRSVKANIEITFSRDAKESITGFTAVQEGSTEWVKTK